MHTEPGMVPTLYTKRKSQTTTNGLVAEKTTVVIRATYVPSAVVVETFKCQFA